MPAGAALCFLVVNLFNHGFQQGVLFSGSFGQRVSIQHGFDARERLADACFHIQLRRLLRGGELFIQRGQSLGQLPLAGKKDLCCVDALLQQIIEARKLRLKRLLLALELFDNSVSGVFRRRRRSVFV